MSELVDRESAIKGLREAADLLEKLDHVPRFFVEVEAYNLDAEQMAAAARVKGTWEKDATDHFFKLIRSFHGVPVVLHADRDQVCVARETGNTVKVKKVVTPAVYEEVEVPEVEWDCLPLLAGNTQEPWS